MTLLAIADFLGEGPHRVPLRHPSKVLPCLGRACLCRVRVVQSSIVDDNPESDNGGEGVFGIGQNELERAHVGDAERQIQRWQGVSDSGKVSLILGNILFNTFSVPNHFLLGNLSKGWALPEEMVLALFRRGFSG